MGLYDRYLLPRLVHLTCGVRPIMRQRQKVVPRASGRVLEVGFGSGLNLAFYDPRSVSRLWAVEPSAEMRALAARRVDQSPLEIELVDASAEEVPLEDGSMDTVLVTYTLCTIPDVGAALAETRRLLADGGRLLFCEHGAAPDPGVRRWQERLDWVWGRLSGGCHLNREIPRLISEAGFEVTELETMYLPGWRPAGFNYWGVAARLD